MTMGLEVAIIKRDGHRHHVLGTIEFFACPIRNQKDFICNPRDLISFESAGDVSREIATNKVTGDVDEIDCGIWRL